MSHTDTAHDAEPAAVAVDQAGHGGHTDEHGDQTAPAHHESDLLYVKVFAVLFVITAAEVALPYVADVEGPIVAAMLVMMVLKFGLVIAYFMHLKFDSKIFRRVFMFGVVLAVTVYIAALATFEFWVP